MVWSAFRRFHFSSTFISARSWFLIQQQEYSRYVRNICTAVCAACHQNSTVKSNCYRGIFTADSYKYVKQVAIVSSCTSEVIVLQTRVQSTHRSQKERRTDTSERTNNKIISKSNQKTPPPATLHFNRSILYLVQAAHVCYSTTYTRFGLGLAVHTRTLLQPVRVPLSTKKNIVNPVVSGAAPLTATSGTKKGAPQATPQQGNWSRAAN